MATLFREYWMGLMLHNTSFWHSHPIFRNGYRFSLFNNAVYKGQMWREVVWIGKLAVLDISESGKQIGEKLLALLDVSQQQELMQYVLAQAQGGNPDIFLHSISTHTPAINPDAKLTEVQAEDLYFCLEIGLYMSVKPKSCWQWKSSTSSLYSSWILAAYSPMRW